MGRWLGALPLAVVVAGCVGDDAGLEGQGGGVLSEPAIGGSAPEAAVDEVDLTWVHAARETLRTVESPRGLGRMTARRPGQESVIGGVVLASHHVNVVISGGVATTTVEEVFENRTNEVLEGRFVFPVPAGSSVSDLVLWVEGTPVPAELVEKRRAASIFKGIVDDTVRPRDPALLEWSQGQELSLKIFPIFAKSTRKVAFTFEQRVEDLDGSAAYVYPLSPGAERGTPVGSFSVTVRVEDPTMTEPVVPGFDVDVSREPGAVTVHHEAKNFLPASDFALAYTTEVEEDAVAFVESAAACPAGTDCRPTLPGATIVRTVVAAERSEKLSPSTRVIVLDASASQEDGWGAQVALAMRLVAPLSDTESFSVLVCSSTCAAFPADALNASATDDNKGAVLEWLSARSPRGASDVAGGIQQGLARIDGVEGGQLVYVGDGVASAGSLASPAIAARLESVAPDQADVRIVGTGRNVDALALQVIARSLGGTYEPFDGSGDLEQQLEAVASAIERPVVRDLVVELPEGFTTVVEPPTAMRAGDELELFAYSTPGATGEVRLTGTIGGEPFEQTREVKTLHGPVGMASRGLASARIDELEAQGADTREIVELSTRFFVMSRHTSMIVLENDAMFASFGIPRTRGAKVAGPSSGGSVAENRGQSWGAAAPAMGLSGTGDGFGAGGLGLSGIGEGGGGTGIGLGSIGTIGKGEGAGFGSGTGRLGGSHRSRPPMVRMGASSVSGRLPPEVIQRIVRQNFGRFRLCYESALRSNPTLGGTISVRFVIGRDGSVASAAPGGGTISDATMTRCLVQSFARLAFPQPEGGVVTVTYPIRFAPEDSPAMRALHATPPVLAAGDDDWMRGGDVAIVELRRAVSKEPEKRSARAALVRGLLKRGRFDEAAVEAGRYLEIDPDAVEPKELYAQALLASGDAQASLDVLEGMAETNPRGAALHVRVAKAAEASGEEERACAHWVSVVELDAGFPQARFEAWRCRARVFGDAERVATEIRALPDLGGKETEALLRDVEAGSVAAYRPRTPSTEAVFASAKCTSATAACPHVFLIDDRGNVVSDRLPDASGNNAPSAWSGGNFRAVLAGGDENADVEVTLAVRTRTRSVVVSRAKSATALYANVPPI